MDRRRNQIAVFSIGAFLAFGAGLTASQQVGSRIVMDKVDYNFGSVVQGARLTHTWTVFNKGDAPLQISSVTNECPCFKVTSFNKIVGVEGRGHLTAEIDTTGMEGPLYLTPVITSNDPRKPKSNVRIRGFVEGPVALLPKSTFALSTVRGDSKTVEFTVKNNTPRALKIRGVESSEPMFAPTLRTVTPGKEYRVTVRTAANAEIGKHQALIKITTDSPVRPELEARISLVVVPSVVAKPETLHLPVMTEAEARRGSGEKEWTLELTDQKGRAFKVLDIKSAPYVSVSATPRPDGKSYQLAVALKPNAALKPGVTPVNISVITNLPTASTVRIPVIISVLAPG